MTKVINVEDTMPYVAPKEEKKPDPYLRRPGTRMGTFCESLEFSADCCEENAVYYRETKANHKAHVEAEAAEILQEVLTSDYPESRLESVLDFHRRLYMALSLAQMEALDAVKRKEEKHEKEKAQLLKDLAEQDARKTREANDRKVAERVLEIKNRQTRALIENIANGAKAIEAPKPAPVTITSADGVPVELD